MNHYCSIYYKKGYTKFKFSAVGNVLDLKISAEKMGAMELKLMEDGTFVQVSSLTFICKD